MRFRLCVGIVGLLLAVASLPAAASADRVRPDPNVAGLQTALAVKGFYRGPIDGIRGPLTAAALRAFRAHFRLSSLNLADRRTQSLLGGLGRPRYGTRTLRSGMVGLDVAALQFELRYHGFPNRGRGAFGPETAIALKGFQRFAGIRPDGTAGRATYNALAKPPPAPPKLKPPLPTVSGVTNAGRAVELGCPYATPVAAGTAGIVVVAANRSHGYGYTVVTRDRRGFEVLYAHLARIDVRVGQRLAAGALIGVAGWTGKRTPTTTLRIELRLRGAQLDAYHALFRR